ncbi:hypothetical protein KDH_17120 [Dictyobacter sp. S3.2.2.5]|uniref:Uncharacterized protein n=1 Tax=Dictyobacter halimunensis TaxID=3026934 RepID=A0ABQ6FKT0_9CHLR|nr:hypothetical protein KDH_16630 [Dictyobacter sp. S3.2.2.5]GLV54865.1 hypothetical protein KDH_17120 [Dictyobacter sp. S3.2.2.5]
MVQFKKGMMIFKQIETAGDLQRGQAAQQRVVLTTRMRQPQETRDRMFKKGMMVGVHAKESY